MLKRPGYIIGHVLIIGLVFYFLVRAFGPESFEMLEWPKTANMVGIVVGTGAGVFVVWLILKLSKVKHGYLKFALAFWGLWMLAFGLLTIAQPHSKREWEFAIYAALTFLGWLCCTSSIREHFCEKIFMSQKERKF